MQNWKALLLLGLPLAAACGDKEIEEEETEPSSEPSAEDTGTEEEETNEPLVPVAIGFEYSGIWNEGGNNGDGSLDPYLFPDLNNENGGVPFALGNLVTVTLASIEYFSLGSGATDEERAFETCTVYADFAYSPANLLAQDFDWTTGTGGLDNVELWQSFEGTLVFRLDSASDRCAELDEGHSLDQFDGMRFGIGMGPLSTYMSGEFESTDWWADDADAQGSYHTQYIAVNHPAETDLGYNFVAYDWTSAIMVNIDTESCVDAATGEVVASDVESESKVCGEVMTVEVDGSPNYDLADQNENFGSRNVYVSGSSWWYEDYPNLDLDLMKEYPEQ